MTSASADAHDADQSGITTSTCTTTADCYGDDRAEARVWIAAVQGEPATHCVCAHTVEIGGKKSAKTTSGSVCVGTTAGDRHRCNGKICGAGQTCISGACVQVVPLVCGAGMDDVCFNTTCTSASDCVQPCSETTTPVGGTSSSHVDCATQYYTDGDDWIANASMTSNCVCHQNSTSQRVCAGTTCASGYVCASGACVVAPTETPSP